MRSAIHRLDRLLTAERLRVYPAMASVGLLVAWLAVALLGSGWLDATGRPLGPDFVALYTAAEVVGGDAQANAYLGKDFDHAQDALFPDRAGGYTYWLNPPNALLLYYPFGALEYGHALLCWWALNLAAWALGHLILHTCMPPRWDRVRMLGWSVVFTPTLLWFTFGQATGVAFLVLVGSYVLIRRGSEASGGALLGLLAFKPQLALGLALPLIFRLRWRALLAGGTVLALQLLGSYALWPAQYAYFVEALPEVREVLQLPGGISWGSQTVSAFWMLLLGGIAPKAATVATWCTTGAVLGALVRGWRTVPWDPNDRRWQLAMAATLVTGLLISPHLWAYDLALLLLPFWILVGAHDIRPGTRLGGGIVLRYVVVIWVLSFVGLYATRAMEVLTARWLGVSVAVQVLVPVLLYVAWSLWPRETQIPANSTV